MRISDYFAARAPWRHRHPGTRCGTLGVLAEHRIGAVVVLSDGASIDGIASERHIVRALAMRGPR